MHRPPTIEIVKEFLCICYARNGMVGGGFYERSAFKMGFCGSGVMWCLRERDGTFITFNSVRIARRDDEDGTWYPIPAEWTVTSVDPFHVLIQLNKSDGVVLPYRGGGRA